MASIHHRSERSRAPRASFRRVCTVSLVAVFSVLPLVSAVKHSDFKTCAQSGFCNRNRAYADRATSAGASFVSPYELDTSSLKLEKGELRGTIFKTIDNAGSKVELPLLMSFYNSGVARVEIDEARRQKGDIELRHDSKARKERYNEAGKWALTGRGLDLNPHAGIETFDGGSMTRIKYGGMEPAEVVITHKPFKVSFMRDGEAHVIFNEKNFMNVEHWRPKLEKKEGEPEDPSEYEGWDETFGGNTDSKPRGPESIAMDITFPGYEHVYGIPEHATTLSLKQTRGKGEGHYSDPYRLYNADVFEYEMDSPMTLYGSIPFMQAQRKGSTVGVFWLNAAETWIDITKDETNPMALGPKKSTTTHWISEAGVLDVFVFLGPNASWMYQQYGELTGYTTLPQMFSIGYHQCRWNYVSQEDVKTVDKKMDQFDLPYDVIWLDIEYTDGKRYFTWDPLTFKKPLDMLKGLDKRARKLVAIIDPHIKKADDYKVGKEITSLDLAARDKSGKSYEGWCWPGSSHWVDCTNPATVKWWKEQFKFDKFVGSARNLHIWNDMNEPSVFNGPETTMPKDNLFHDNWEHRDHHNIYGMTYHNATYEGVLERESKNRDKQIRPFVLTRSFFAGSQRTAAMWTGDNEAKWDHLQASIPMLLAQGIAGMPFAGADVGGFFGNPSKELLTRWYQAGAFYPFFRGHAHIDAKRREPYLAGEPYTSVIRNALRLRYSLLPSWYSAFHRASWDGMPILRPMFVMFPDNEAGFSVEDQFFMGDTGLLVKPQTHENGESVDIFLPDGQRYYDYDDYTVHTGENTHVTVSTPLEKIPILMRGGHIFTRRDRPRRSSALMKHDPFTLVVSVGTEGVAGGVLYLDDGESFDYEKGHFIHRSFMFTASDGVLRSGNLHRDPKRGAAFEKTMKGVRVERVILVGVDEKLGESGVVKVTQGNKSWEALVKVENAGGNGKARVLVIRDPKVEVSKDWDITIQ